MRKLIIITGLSLLAAPAMAMGKPDNATQVQTQKDREGIGCYVRAGEADPYVYDATCKSHWQYKFDKDGNLTMQRYQDQGQLQPGQTAPDRAVRLTFPLNAYCNASEVISPSGRYTSNFICRY